MKTKFSFALIGTLIMHVGLLRAPAQSPARRVIHAELRKDKESEPSTKFSADVPHIYAFWKGEALHAGDKIRAVWIAEDVGDVAPKEAKITEGNVVVYKPNADGAFSLSRPPGQVWPVGKYRLHIYIGDALTETVKFTIEPGVVVQVR